VWLPDVTSVGFDGSVASIWNLQECVAPPPQFPALSTVRTWKYQEPDDSGELVVLVPPTSSVQSGVLVGELVQPYE
jgi:hypothetical protein